MTVCPHTKTYLDRDALKVLGCGGLSQQAIKAMAALFYLNPNKKHGGGTGHTIRLCEAENVPYFLNDDCDTWMPSATPPD